MVQFTKLRVTGFKSFADNTDLDIMPGLTGIVGPNGCGKSNLVEALRWMMGETSPKSMRGGEMDDVIFAGTARRPARNFAEVLLTIQNPDRDAPDPYTNIEQIEISRRIDRGMGSDYKINGKNVRAADSSLFFADSSAGAHSPAIVSQGRVADMISAKPVDRRRVLENAANISGLHNRRKEAETRLRAAEKNLQRVDDLLSQKNGLYTEFLKQAKQAERYKTLSDVIRRLDAMVMAMEWSRLSNDIEAAQSAMTVANEAQNQAKQNLYDLGKRREGLQTQWDHLERQLNDVQQRIAQQQRQKERAEEELQRYEQSRTNLQSQIETLEHDRDYEKTALATATEKTAALTAEKTELEQKLNNFSGDVDIARTSRDTAKTEYDTALQALNTKRAELAALNAQRQMLHQQIQRLQSEKSSLTAEQDRVTQILAQLATELQNTETDSAQQRVTQLDQTLQATLDHVTQLEKQSEAGTVTVKSAYETLQSAQSALNHIDTEIKALSSLAETAHKDQNFPIMLDQVNVQSGYEQALAVALGRELRAGMDTSAPMYWQETTTSNLPSLPGNTPTLYSLVKAPQALQAALSMVGVVTDQSTGENLAKQLQPGQMLVSKDGFGWRWDGYTVTPSAQASAQERETKQLLEQRNRLGVLRNERTDVATEVEKAQAQYNTTQSDQNALRQQTTDARNQLTQLQRDVAAARQQSSAAQQKFAEIQARQQALTEKQSDIAHRLTQTEQNAAQLQSQIDHLPPEATLQSEVETLQSTTQTTEDAYRAKDQEYLTLNSQQTQWQQRLNGLHNDLREWQQREQSATSRLENLATRLDRVNEALGELKSPDHVQEQMAEADQKLKQLDTEAFDINSRRTETAKARQALDAENQGYQENLMGAREALVRAETQFQNAQEQQQQVVDRCDQTLNCEPDAIAGEFGFGEEELGQNLQTIRAKQDKSRAERDRIGAVNLRAEEEAATLGAEIETLTKEKEDVVDAIEKLRHGISTLNRDARKKMLAAFDDVNTRFKETFTRLFNGGEAYLQLIDAEDPLEAGLEIYAQPPGKKLQTMTLLSGGEQSLTAIALVFSMFLTNPSPICILDEIDAALDDSNVERICSLLGDFAKTHPTRFLVITHNPITMANMDRLYGVTMVEKGISKLVSVDLERHQQQHELAIAAE
jgi:chromosome segregation protein